MPHPLTRHLEPHAAFLLEAVCSDEESPQAAPQLDVEALVSEARRQFVGGVLVQWAKRHPDAPGSAAIVAALGPAQKASAMRALFLVGQTRALVALLQDAGIRAIPLKGPLLSKRLYGDYATRDSGDIDLLIDPPRAMDADRLLRANGYLRTKPFKPLSPRRQDLYLRTQHEFGYHSADRSSGVELHWRYSDCPGLPPASFDEVRSRTEAVDVGGALIPTLGVADTFVQLAIHGFTDGWSRLKWIADLPRALKAVKREDLRQLQDDADQRGFGNLVRLALILAGDGEVASPGVLEEALPYVAMRLQNPHPRTMTLGARLVHSRATKRLLNLLIDEPELHRQMEYCNRIMPSDFDRLPLPDTLTGVLPYLAPVGRTLRILVS